MSKNETVFIGAVTGYYNLANTTLADHLISDNIGLYGHGVSETQETEDGKMKDITSAMKVAQDGGTAAGVAELGFDYEMGYGTVTLKNNSSQSITINAGDITFTNSSGDIYILPGETSAPARTNYAYNDYDKFTIPANSSLTVYIEASESGEKYNMGSNGITSILSTSGQNLSQLSITSSSSVVDGNNSIIDNGKSLLNPLSIGSIVNAWDNQGFPVSEANVNVPNNYVMTQNDLISWKNFIDNVRQSNVMNIDGIFNQISKASWLNSDATPDTLNDNTKQAIIYGGGFAIDMPAKFGLTLNAGSQYLTNTMMEIKWAKSEGLRVSWIISPNGSGSKTAPDYDANMLSDVKEMVAILEKNNALPTQIIVENYTTNTQGGVNTPDLSDPEGLDKIAEYVSSLDLTPSNSEAGLEISGQKGADMMMSGIKPNVSINYGTTSSIYDMPYFFTALKNNIVTMTLNTGTYGLILSDSNKNVTISDNGEILTAKGTEAELTDILQNLKITDNAPVLNGNSGTSNMSLVFSDDNYTITGNTNIAYSSNNTTGTIEQGDTKNINVITSTASFLGKGGDISVSGNSNIALSGSYNNISVNNYGQNSTYITLSGSGNFSNMSGIANITMEKNSVLSLDHVDGAIYSVGGFLNKFGNNNINMFGNLDKINLNDGNNNVVSTNLSGWGFVSNASGSIGITLNNNTSNLTVSNSYVYVTADEGDLTLNGGQVNLSSGNIKGDSYVTQNNGFLNYNANVGNSTITLNNGNAKLDYGKGYTATQINMSEKHNITIEDFTPQNGLVVATNLKNMTDLSVTYNTNEAIISSITSGAKIVLDGIGNNNVDLLSSLNNDNFSKQYGSNTLMLAINSNEHHIISLINP